MNTKLIRKTCPIFSLKIPLDMSLTAYPIELKDIRKLRMHDCGMGKIY